MNVRELAKHHHLCGERVYVDADQCQQFRAQYRAACELVIAASTLLGSHDYDDRHRAILAPLGDQILSLEREGVEAPGWYKITGVYPA
jgi:hypothetical protein